MAEHQANGNVLLGSIGDLTRQIDAMKRHVAQVDEEKESLAAKVAALEKQLKDERTAAQLIEKQNADLVVLHVATRQLHEAFNRIEVLVAIQEVIVNLVGSEEYGVYEVAEDGKTLALVASAGIDAAAFREIGFDDGPIGQVARTGEPILIGKGDPTGLIACIPLRVGTVVTGAIAIFRLLPQKPELEAVDHEILQLLTTQAAMALYCVAFQSTRPTIRPAEFARIITALRPHFRD